MSKKTAKTPKEVSSYETRDVVLGKVRGYPPWPGMVVDPATVPPAVAKERPSSKKATFYCVRFFPTGDYAWLVAKDISKLQPHEIESYINEPFKRSGDLLQGYRIALDPTKWEQEVEAAGQVAVEEEANAEIDELESERDDDDSAKAKSKKRKRLSDAAPKAKKVAPRSRRNGTKSRAMIESEDEGDVGDAEGARGKKASPPPTKKAKRDKEEDAEDAKLANDPEALRVRDWRHKLQKSFLSNKGLPKDEEMPALNNLFTTVENYDKINIQYLSFSKIGKVMRHIAILPEEKVPRDAEFKFRDRAKALVDKWHQILNAGKPNGDTVTAPTSNGMGDKGTEQTNEPGTDAPKDEKPQESEEAKIKESQASQESDGQPMDIDETNGTTTMDAPGSPVPAQSGGAPAEVGA
ncbi:hypothetical protein AX15_005435 [Amanita polypyramis BW_CC]|nr:hypothetical protein AX15_005435 [Amanita polypyramis BW_CC]